MIERSRKHLTFGLLLVLAFLLRFYGLASKGIWIDEAYSVHLASMNFLDLIRSLSLESTPPLYYVILNWWTHLFGSNEGSVRFLSLIFSLGEIAGFYCLIRKHISEPVGLLATWLMAISPIHVYYAQEARMYALLSLSSIILLYYSLEFLKDGHTKYLFGVGLSSLLMLFTHNVAAWFVAGCFISFLPFAHNRKMVIQWSCMITAVMLAYLPWLLILLKQIESQATVLQWFVPFWKAKFLWEHLGDTFANFFFGPFPPYLAIRQVFVGGWLVNLAVIALMGLGMYHLKRIATFRFCVLLFACTITLALGYSLLVQPVYIPGRTDFYFLPLVLLFTASGIMALKIRLIRFGIIGLLGILAFVTLINYYPYPEKNNSRTYMEAVREQVHEGDIIITTGLTYAECEYYCRKWNLPVKLYSYPSSARDHPGYLNFSYEMRHPDVLMQDAELLVTKFKKAGTAHNKAIMLLVPHQLNSLLVRRFSEEFAIVKDSQAAHYRQSLIRVPVRIICWQEL